MQPICYRTTSSQAATDEGNSFTPTGSWLRVPGPTREHSRPGEPSSGEKVLMMNFITYQFGKCWPGFGFLAPAENTRTARSAEGLVLFACPARSDEASAGTADNLVA